MKIVVYSSLHYPYFDFLTAAGHKSLSFFNSASYKIKLLKLIGSLITTFSGRMFQRLCNLGLSNTSILWVGRFSALQHTSTTSACHGTSWSLKPNQTQGFQFQWNSGQSLVQMTLHIKRQLIWRQYTILSGFWQPFLWAKHWSNCCTKLRQIFRQNISKIA